MRFWVDSLASQFCFLKGKIEGRIEFLSHVLLPANYTGRLQILQCKILSVAMPSS